MKPTSAERAQIDVDHRIGTFVERGALAFVVVNDQPYRIVRPDGETGPGEPVLYTDRPIPPSAIVYVVDPVSGEVNQVLAA